MPKTWKDKEVSEMDGIDKFQYVCHQVADVGWAVAFFLGSVAAAIWLYLHFWPH